MPMPRNLRLCRGRARGKKEDTTDDRRGTKEGEGKRNDDEQLEAYKDKLPKPEGSEK